MEVRRGEVGHLVGLISRRSSVQVRPPQPFGGGLFRTTIHNRRYRARNTKFLQDYLSNHICVDCGESDVVVLEFDHVRGKKLGNVSDLANTPVSLETLKKEVAKCEVRCANCHRRKTFKERKRGSRIQSSVE